MQIAVLDRDGREFVRVGHADIEKRARTIERGIADRVRQIATDGDPPVPFPVAVTLPVGSVLVATADPLGSELTARRHLSRALQGGAATPSSKLNVAVSEYTKPPVAVTSGILTPTSAGRIPLVTSPTSDDRSGEVTEIVVSDVDAGIGTVLTRFPFT